MLDFLIVGGGVIGLSLAYELAGRQKKVRVIDSREPAREASWAGAGILPPAGERASGTVEKYTALSNRMHAEWHQRLLRETGIDNGYCRSGGIYLARDGRSGAELRAAAQAWQRDGIEWADVSSSGELARLAPNLEPAGDIAAAYYLPDECQIRNPRHVRALVSACERLGVEISSGIAAEDFVVAGGRIEAVRTRAGLLAADRFCITAGPWTAPLLGGLAPELRIRPVRGQIALLSLPERPFRQIVNEGRRYLVPRDDGRVLVGSTEEDVGFDRSNTSRAIDGLLAFAYSLCPALAQGRLERTWAGLRPASADGLPYLGRIERLENGFVAAGHFRAGLQLSTGTAHLMARLMLGEPLAIDLAPFGLERGVGEA